MNFLEERNRLISELKQVANIARRRNDDRWPVDLYVFPHRNSVEGHTLEPVLGKGVPLQTLVDERKDSGKPTHVLELFGSAAFLTDPDQADSLTGVRLKDTQYADRPRQRGDNHELVFGNIYLPDTLKKVSENLRRRNIPAVDIAVCAPFGYWGTGRLNYKPNVLLDVYYPILEWTYQNLNPDEGTLLTEVPLTLPVTLPALKIWSRNMNESGIPTTVVNGIRKHAIKITRRPDSPPNVVPLAGRYARPE